MMPLVDRPGLSSSAALVELGVALGSCVTTVWVTTTRPPSAPVEVILTSVFVLDGGIEVLVSADEVEVVELVDDVLDSDDVAARESRERPHLGT